MLDQACAAAAFALIAASGLLTSNFLFDRGVPDTVSRRAAPAMGGAAFLIAVLWLDVWAAVALSGVLALSTLALRLGYRRGVRGISRSPQNQDWAETAYPVAATVSLVVGWGLLGDRWLAFLPIAFMAWGDSVAGLVRGVARWSSGRMDAWRPSIAMLCVCLTAALLIQPYWIGVAGAVVATASERSRLIANRVWDDSWVPDDPVIVAASLSVMAALVNFNR